MHKVTTQQEWERRETKETTQLSRMLYVSSPVWFVCLHGWYCDYSVLIKWKTERGQSEGEVRRETVSKE